MNHPLPSNAKAGRAVYPAHHTRTGAALAACAVVVLGFFLLSLPAKADLDFWPTLTFPGKSAGQFGYTLTSFGTDYCLVGEPFSSTLDAGQRKNGSVTLLSRTGTLGTFLNPSGIGGWFGYAIAAVDGSRFLASAPTNNVFAKVYLCRVASPSDGSISFQLITTITNPFPQVSDGFGLSVAAVGSNWVVIGAPNYNATQNGAGRVYLYRIGVTNAPLVMTIAHPTPGLGANFGHAVVAVGPDRFAVSAPNDKIGSRLGAGKVYLYSTNGTLLKTIQDPNPSNTDRNTNDAFGFAIAEVGLDMFAVSARGVDHVSATATNLDVGAVYLFHKSGQFLRTVPTPAPVPGSRFGHALARLGTERFLVGSTNTSGRGRVHLFSLSGDSLATLDDPAPNSENLFGHALASVGNDWFVVGDRLAANTQSLDGSVYLYDARLPQYFLGQEIEPPAGLALADLVESGPEIEPPGAAFWHRPTVYDAKLYATRAGRITLRWKTRDGATISVQALNIWPTEPTAYQLHIAQTPTVELRDGGAYNWAGLMDTEDGTGADPAEVGNHLQFSATGPGRSLLMLAANNPVQDAEIFFQPVKTVTWDDLAYLYDHNTNQVGQQDAPANIGEALDAMGYHDDDCGGPWVFWPNSFYNADPGYYDRANRTGPIIPVNLDQPGYTNDMVAVYYQKSTSLKDATWGLPRASSIGWPWKAVRYRCEWPVNPTKLIIADLSTNRPTFKPTEYYNWQIYVQNDPTRPGFNPNDEHALRFPWGDSESIFPLRDDLGTPTTSEPYVLMKYDDPADGLKPKMKVFRVLAQESPTHVFDYSMLAGVPIQPPAPLSKLPLCEESTAVAGPSFRDRKQAYWAKAAADDGQSAIIIMKYFYPVQTGFYFPSSYFAYFPSGVPHTHVPPPGTHFPWLDVRWGTNGVPHDIRYTVSWPTQPAKLFVGETLVNPKRGLPDIRSQSSVQILYQQAFAQGHGTSVQLIDPTREREVSFPLPTQVKTVTRSGKQFFPLLPPPLRNRLFYDPINSLLKLRGEFVTNAIEPYLLLNLLTEREKTVVGDIYPLLLSPVNLLPSSVIPVAPNATEFDSLALTAGFARGAGFVTLAFGNSDTLSDPDEPVSLEVIRVDCPTYRGAINVVESDNPFDEKLTLRHSGDFAGRAEQYIFDWRTMPPVDGLPSTLHPTNWTFQPTVVASGHANGQGAVDITLQGANLSTLTDNYFVCRYRPIVNPVCSPGADPADPRGWSEWTDPMLAEGWIKRVLAGINPFEQRFKAFEEHTINTIVSMISQAGPRYEGPVPLSLRAADQFGLIEIYETVFQRGMELSLDGSSPLSDQGAYDALLLAAGRLADLYMLLGNEAYADAADPTIAFGTEDGIYGAEATSIHCFMNQTSSLLEEELALLRGRDGSLLPSVRTSPVYNRLAWNFTHDIIGGELAYALNYNIRDESGRVDGSISEADARALYPQGHGDAWGHYLTAIKHYYRLLRHPNFVWSPRPEAVLVGGMPVSVDFLDERKFARAAAARAKTGAEIVNLTYRRDYLANPEGRLYQDTKLDRAWGVADWGSRAGQGAYLDWVAGNALLPDRDPTLTDVPITNDHVGIQIVDRTTVTELREIAAAFREIQAKVDTADNRLNPLGLADNALPFDISPAGIDQGKSHFEQIYDRAVSAMNNAITVFNHANNSTQLLRRQADSQAEFAVQAEEREMDFKNRLIELFGYPYGDDIGPTGTYPTDYDGPDIYHYDYVDASELMQFKVPAVQTVTLKVREMDVDQQGALSEEIKNVKFHISTTGFGLIKPASWSKKRRAQGELQMARSDLLQTKARFDKALLEYDNLVGQIQDKAALLKQQQNVNAEEIELRTNSKDKVSNLNEQIRSSQERQLDLRKQARIVGIMQDAIAEALPLSVGLANDVTSIGRSALRIFGTIMTELLTQNADSESLSEMDHQSAKEINRLLDELALTTLHNEQGVREQVAQIEQLIRQEVPLRLELYTLRETLQQTGNRYLSSLARGLRMLEDRLRFRQQTAVEIQSYRYKDMAFRIFRNDALQKYRAQFDLAAMYVHLAVKAFDFETCPPQDDAFSASSLATDIIRARSLGLMQGGQPQWTTSDVEIGLADPLAWMNEYWTAFGESELGFNNPQTDTGRFSLRTEFFRILRGETGNAAWRETLSRHVVPHFPDLPEVRRYCVLPEPMTAAEPALVIPFSTTINFAQNFFAWPLGGGDNSYNSTHNATKIRSVGVWFANYNTLVEQGLANTPHLYLVPVGSDMQRCRPDDSGFRAVREWKVFDQKLPAPFQFNGRILEDNLTWIPFTDSLPQGEELAELRKHPMFRAYHDSGSFTPAETIDSSRLIGRSVWNTRWLLIIPGGSLHHDRQEGLLRLIHGPIVNGQRNGNGISDIRLFFQTYSYAGN